MSQIDSIVQLEISRQTAQVDIEAFDIPLILVEMDSDVELVFTDRIRTYTSIDGVIDDLGTKHDGYVMAAALLSNDLKPATFKIGKKKVTETHIEALSAIQDLDDTWYALVMDSHLDDDVLSVAKYIQPQRKMYFFSTSSPTALLSSQAVTYTGIVHFGDVGGAIEDDSVIVTISGEKYQSIYTSGAWTPFAFAGAGAGGFDGIFTFDSALTGDLTITHTSKNFVVTKASTKFNGVETVLPSSSIEITDPVGMDIAQRLKSMGMFRSVPLFSNTADNEWPEASWVGSQLVEVPGSNTWEYKKLAGVTVSRLTDSQISLLESRGYNYYIPIKGANVTRRGKTSDGEWVDVIQLVDWLHARIQEQIFYRLINTKKIPFTAEGATTIANEIYSVLNQATANGGIDGYQVHVPQVLAIPEMQRASRVMGDFTFDARIAGAVSVVVIRGVVHP